MNIINENIKNLVSLWQLGGNAAGELFTNKDYSLSIVRHSQWPNKLWFHRNPDYELLNKVNSRWDLNDITVSIWDNHTEEIEDLLLSNGFTLKSQLSGMSLSLGSSFKPVKKLQLLKVNSHELAKIWSHLFLMAFGYEIQAKTVELTMNKVDYYIVKDEEVLIGSAVLYKNEPKIAGIHSMGIIPEQRRKGYAENLLTHVLNIARQNGASYATLQASDMGKGLYLKTGFNEDFKLKNYVKNKY